MAAMRVSGAVRWLVALGLLVACGEDAKKPSDVTSGGASGQAGTGSGTAGVAPSSGAGSGAGASDNAGGAPESCAVTCSDICVDLQEDEGNCGRCGEACRTGEACEAGECVCAEGLERCGQSCLDFQTNPLHCGKCNHSCGNGACDAGECVCAEGSVDCSSNNVLSCRPVQDDVKNCGDCDKRCLDVSVCSAGKCDADLELVRLIGGAAPAAYRATLAVGASGDVFASVESSGERLALPGGKVSLWEGSQAIIKLDADLDFEWSVIVSGPAQLAADGDDVWVALSASFGPVQIGAASFEPDNGSDVVIVVAKLSGADGHILESHRFAGDPRQPVKLLATSGGVFVAMGVGTGVDYLDKTSVPPELSSFYSALFRIGKSTPRWIPGEVYSLSADDDGKVIIGVLAPGNVPISFGGDSFKSGLRWGNVGVARYNASLGHEASFVMPDASPSPAIGVFPSGKELMFVGATFSTLELRDFTGKLLGSVGTKAYDFTAGLLLNGGGRVWSAGYSQGAQRSVLGRQFSSDVGFVHGFDALTGKLLVAFSVPYEGAYGGVTGLALAPDGSSMTIAFGFNGAFELAGKSYGLPAARGLALARLKLE